MSIVVRCGSNTFGTIMYKKLNIIIRKYPEILDPYIEHILDDYEIRNNPYLLLMLKYRNHWELYK